MKTQCEEALRQFRHNDGSGLVAGYDKDTIDRVIADLRDEVERLEKRNQEYAEQCAELNKEMVAQTNNANSAQRRADELRRILAVVVSQLTGKAVVLPEMRTRDSIQKALSDFATDQQIKALGVFKSDVENNVQDGEMVSKFEVVDAIEHHIGKLRNQKDTQS